MTDTVDVLDTHEDLESLAPAGIKTIAMRIGENLYNRLNKIVRLIKHLDNHGQTKQNWMAEAVKEKLERELEQDVIDICRERFIQVKLDQTLNERVNEHVDGLKNNRISFSKKHWLVEALYDKLDRDEEKLRRTLKERQIKK